MRLILLILTTLSFGACVTQKKLLILEDSVLSVSDSLQYNLVNSYKLQSGDILDIKVSSLDPNSVAVFNKAVGVNFSSVYNEASLYTNGYMIDQFGDVNLPLIGDLMVKELTIDSLNVLLDQKLASYFKFYTVEAKLVNYRVSVLGEVKIPGTQQVYNSDLNILQALSNVGGISDHGNRNKIKVIRKAFGKNEVAVIDLSDENVINNKFFYLMPNDIIYIPPYKSKATSLNVPLFALLISTASFLVLILNSNNR